MSRDCSKCEMLPDDLSGSYKAYKSDTNAFVTWLSRTALACGYKLPRANVDTGSSTRLKGKARKEAKAATTATSNRGSTPATASKQMISTSDLLAQAKHIANYKKPPVKVPVAIQYVLQQSIKARKRCASWFQKTTTDDNSSDHHRSTGNAIHQHFIGILELAANILKPCFDSSPALKTSTSCPDNPRCSDKANSKNSLNNRFGSLEIEEINEHELALMVPAALDPSSTASRNSKPQSRGVFELRVDVPDELPFIIFCFFEDMNKIREFLNRIWENVATENLDYMAASITTNAALELVRKAEEEIIILYPEFRTSHTYPTMFRRLFPSTQISFSGQIITQLENIPRGPDSEFSFFSTFISLRNYCSTVQLEPDKGPFCTSLASVYSAMPTLTPLNAEWETEDRLLAQMFLDLEMKFGINVLKSRYEQAQHKGWLARDSKTSFRPSSFEDEILTSFDSVLIDGRLNTHVVFNARILLDIHRIIGPQVQAAYENLRLRGAIAEKVLGINWTTQPATKARPAIIQNREELFEDWLREDLACQATCVAFTVKQVIKENSIILNKEWLFSSGMTGTGWAARSPPSGDPATTTFTIWPSKDISFFANNNPINAGLESLKLMSGLHKIGIDLANALGSIGPMAHLYNTLQQKGLLRGRWYALDKFIEAHINPIFKGSLPSSQEQCSRRFFLLIQTPVEAFASDGKTPDFGKILVNMKDTFQHERLTGPLGEYLEGKSSAEKLLYACQNSGYKKPRRAPLTQREMLAQLCEGISQLIPKLDHDMITLTRQCNKLLDQIGRKLEIDVGDQFSSEKIKRMRHSYIVLQILFGCKDELTRLESQLNSGVDLEEDSGTSSDLKTAAEVIQDFLAEANYPSSVQPFDVVAIAKKSVAEYTTSGPTREMENAYRRMFRKD